MNAPHEIVFRRLPSPVVELDYIALEIWRERLWHAPDVFAVRAHVYASLVDGELRVHCRMGGYGPEVPFRAVTELVFHDEHLGVIIARLQQVGVRDVADETVFIEFFGMDR